MHNATCCCSLEGLINPQRKALWQVTSQVTKWRSLCQPANDTLKREKKGRKCSLFFPLQYEHEGFISLIYGWQCQGYSELQRPREIPSFQIPSSFMKVKKKSMSAPTELLLHHCQHDFLKRLR